MALGFWLTESTARGIIASHTLLGHGQTVQNWLAILLIFPAAWVSDRMLGPRRAVVVGTSLLIGGACFAAIGHPLAVYLGLGGTTVGAAFVHANLAVLLGRAYEANDRRRLPGFIWFACASNVALVLAGLGRSTLLDFTGWQIALVVLGVMMSGFLVVFRRSRDPGDAEPASAMNVQPQTRRLLVLLSIAVFLSAVAAVAGALLLRTDMRTDNWGRQATLITAAAVMVLAWAGRPGGATTFAQRRSFRSLALLALATAAFFALFYASPERQVIYSSRSISIAFGQVLAIVLAPLLVLLWRGARVVEPLPAAAAAFAVSFAIQAVPFIAYAAYPDIEASNWRFSMFPLATLTEMLVTTTGMSAVTALAPRHYAARAVAGWHVSVTAGRSLANLGLFTARGLNEPLAVMLAASGIFMAALFFPGRRETSTDPPELRRAQRGRLRRVVLSTAGVVAVASLLWMVAGRSEPADASALVAATPPSFDGADGAFLPDGPTLGFVALAGGVTVGVNPALNPAAPRDEGPAAALTLKPFSIGQYEVTVAQYRQCMVEGGCTPADPRVTNGPDDWPVRYVSWLEALEYCNWLEQQLRLKGADLAVPNLTSSARVTLPSEAEWELAAGGGSRSYPWEGPLVPVRANYAASGRLTPASVGEFSAGASAFGVHDLSGNVAEWTRSEYRPYPYDPADGRENTSSVSTARVIRGGSFYDSESLLRVTARRAADPGRANDFVGFRVVISEIGAAPSGATAK
jgi:formylglycine-generating enzyme required for sulfatase activity/dipeptide/tripeptide permease